MKTPILIALGVIVAAGGAFGAATFGFLQVPGISPTKFGKPILASNDERRGIVDTWSAPLQILVRRAAIEANVPKKVVSPPTAASLVKSNPDKGDQEIAEVWNGLEVEKLADITAKWPEKNLARILMKMDPDQVSELLGKIPAARAVKVSQAIQQLGSVLPPVSQPS